jgi:hypothetical protein
MPSIEVKKWNGSLVTTVSPEEAAPGDFIVLKNFLFDSDGLPRTRGSRRSFGADVDTSTTVIQGLYLVKHKAGTGDEKYSLLCFAAGQLWKYSESTESWTSLMSSWDNLPPEEGNLRPTASVLNGSFVLCTGSPSFPLCIIWKPGWTTAGSATLFVDQGETIEPGGICTTYANRFWIVPRGGSRVYFSAYADPTNFWNQDLADGTPNSSWIGVDEHDGSEITALVPGFAGELLIFKDGPGGGSIHRLSGQTPGTFSLSRMASGIGAVNPHVVTAIKDRDVFFASRRGLHSLRRVEAYGDLEASFLDDEFSDMWRDLPLSVKKLAHAVDDYTRDTWWLSFDRDRDGTNDTTLALNYRHKNRRGQVCASTLDFGFNAAGSVPIVSTHPRMFVTGLVGAFESHHHPEVKDSTTGAAIEWEAKLAPIQVGDRFVDKRWEQIWLSYDNWGVGEATVTTRGDNRRKREKLISMNTGKVPIANNGLYGRFSAPPTNVRVKATVPVHSGGSELSVRLVGSDGPIKLRGLRVDYSELKEIAGSESHHADWRR